MPEIKSGIYGEDIMTGRGESQNEINENGSFELKGKEGVASPTKKTSLKRRLRESDRTLSWILFVVTLLTIITGYTLTRTESQPVPTIIHAIIAVAFAVLLGYHIFIYTFLVKYRWKNALFGIFKKRTSLAFKVISILFIIWIVIEF